MGLHRVTLVRKGFGRQSIPARVGRNETVRLDKVTLVAADAVGSEEAAANLVPVGGGKVLAEDGSPVEVAPFYMDRYEYPNRLGARPACGTTRRPEDGAWSWQAARDLAREAGKQLPTRAQWLLAAAGPDGLRFPYGRDFDPERAAVALADKEGPLPCGSRPGDRSPFGLYDMGGNVSEWVRPDQEPAAPEEEFRDACGGSWTSRDPDQSSCRHVRFYTPADDVSAVGLRCVIEKGQKVQPRVTPRGPGASPAEPRFEEAWVDKCPEDMVLVRPPEGSPARELVDYPFCIDRYEWPNEAEKAPATGVSWEEANRLARAKGRRLPTRDEWRVACGGPELWEYSFGAEYAEGRAWIGRSGLEETPLVSGDRERSVKSPFGAGDLTGNVLEWVWFDRTGARRGAIGGSWISSKEEARASYWPAAPPAARNRVVGFRCVARLREKPAEGR
jgi:formylglycine-generating enzyme required for sulfatase activity